MAEKKQQKKQEKQEYRYKGDVLSFDRVVYRNWKASTFAVSAKRAAANLVFQYKNANGLAPHANIKLASKPIAVA